MVRTNNDTFYAHCMILPRIEDSLSFCPKTCTHCHKPLPSYTIGRLLINEGVTMSSLKNVLQQVRDERKQAELRVERLDEVIRGLAGLNSSSPSRNGAGRSRTLSASARRRISLAQKARWAKVRAGKVVSIAGKRSKSTISAAGRKRIAAAQRARWAKARAAKKAA
jgi:hypothetical protein